MMSFLSSRVLVSSDCKQSITVWFLLLTFYSLFLSFVMGKLSYNANCTCRRFVSKDLVQNQSFPVTLTKGGSWALLRKSAVESTTPAQPFCINQAVGDLPRHFHLSANTQNLKGWKRWVVVEKLTPFDEIKVNLPKLVDICGYELTINSQNFTQSRSKNVPKISGGYFYLKHPVHRVSKNRTPTINMTWVHSVDAESDNVLTISVEKRPNETTQS